MRAPLIALVLGSLCLPAAGFMAGPAWGQSGAARPAAELAKPIGKILNLAGSVTIERQATVIIQANLPPGGTSQAKIGDLVYRGDVIQTGADGSCGIVFGDSTSFKVAANARMELNEFVYDPNGSSNSMLFNLHKGAFTFLAGAVAKTGNMKVETPAATMGIRGTAPRVEILDDGSVRFSTLVEDSKNIQVTPRTPPADPGQRRASRAPSDGDLNKKLRICRNC